MIYPCLKEHPQGTLLALKVLPRSSRNQIVGLHGACLKTKLTSPPVDGAANALCRDYFAKQLGIARPQVELIAGKNSRQKVLLLKGLSCHQVHERLAELLREQGSS